MTSSSNTLKPLPIDLVLPELTRHLESTNTIILRASPGAGKTTRVPPELLKSCQKQILVLEPRRLAARLSAERIADELGEPVGERVGYHIRFEQRVSAKTRIKFITEGLFLRYLLADPMLSNVDCIVLDEFHERHLHTDIALALAKQMQAHIRPDLKIVVMSATLNTEQLSTYFPQAKVITSEVAQYPVDVSYAPNNDRYVDKAVYGAVEKLILSPKCPGHILVFLPGQAQINQCAQALARLSSEFSCDILSLHGSQTFAEQQKVFSESKKRKIILSTNVAETSLTIPGVTGVVDSCLAKISGFAAWSGMPTLDMRKISQASCIQRAGRAGRTAPGSAIRLISEVDYKGLAAFEKPEMVRSDLTHLLLELKALTKLLKRPEFSFENLPWLELPSEKNVSTSLVTLTSLGAVDAIGSVTELGMQMAQSSLHPRLSRLVLKSIELNQASVGALVAAMISESTLLKTEREGHHAHSDFDASIDWYFKSNKDAFDPRVRRVFDLAKQIAGQFKIDIQKKPSEQWQSHLATMCLFAFPDRVAQKRKRSTNPMGLAEYVLCQGGGAMLSKRTCIHHSEFIITIDGDESATAQNAAMAVSIHMACVVEPEHLLEDPAGLLKESKELYWDDSAQRVRGFERMTYGKLIVEETQQNALTPEHTAALCKALKNNWPKPFEDDAPLLFYHNRIDLIKKHEPNVSFPRFDGAHFDKFLESICRDKQSFSEISERELEDYINDALAPEQQQLLQRLLPSHVKIGSGRSVRVNYEADKPPWIGSRLQDFYGTLKTPTILNGRLPLVVHLLAPNMRAVQVTTDLESFWAKAYSEVRKELSRRYPRHSWPEDPKIAEPPPLQPPRKRR